MKYTVLCMLRIIFLLACGVFTFSPLYLNLTRGRYALLSPRDAVGTVPIVHLFTRRQPITNNKTQDESNPIVSEMHSESQANEQDDSDD